MIKKVALVGVFVAVFLALPLQSAIADSGGSADVETMESSSPNALGVALDLLVGRPAMLIGTIVGAGIYAISTPFTALAGREAFDDAHDRLISKPSSLLVDTPLGG